MNKNKETLRKDMMRLYAIAGAECIGGIITSTLLINSACGDDPLSALLMIFPAACLWLRGADDWIRARDIRRTMNKVSINQKQK